MRRWEIDHINMTVDGCQILHQLHQLIGGKHPILYRVSTIQGAGLRNHPQWEFQDPTDGGTLVPYFRPYFGAISPYIGLKNRPFLYGRYLHFRILKFPSVPSGNLT